MNINRLFKDKQGKIVLYQRPNLLLAIWLVLQIADLIMLHGKSQAVSILSTAVLFAWAYGELRQGVSTFRKLLGAAVLLLIIVTAFMR